MNSTNNIEQVIEQFKTVTLDEINSVELMKRVDKKYVFNISMLPAVLNDAMNAYKLLKIENHLAQAYQTVYFDTKEHDMYMAHHRGKLNRYKIRIRKYLSSGDLFLEIKYKNNKGQTIKKRTNSLENFQITPAHGQFIQGLTDLDPDVLKPQMNIEFKRITLVNLERKERVTLDYDLTFQNSHNGGHCHRLENIAIAEVKRNAYDTSSGFSGILRENRIYASGFSKYCIGMALLHKKLKKNRFKQRLRLLQNIDKNLITTS